MADETTFIRDFEVHLSDGNIVSVKAVNEDMAEGIVFEDNIHYLTRSHVKIVKIVRK